MSARFRYVGPDGREVELATTDELVRAFRSGSLRRDALLYDAYGGGWAPARSHSSLMGLDLPDLTFTLAEPAPEPTDEVVAKLLKERESVPDFGALGRGMGIKPTEPQSPDAGEPEAEIAAAPQPKSARTQPSPYLATAAVEPEDPVDEGEGAGGGFPLDATPGVAPTFEVTPSTGPQRPPRRQPRAIATFGAVSGALAGLAIAVFLFSLWGEPTAGGTGAPPVPSAVREAAAAAGFGGPARTGASELLLLEDRAIEGMVQEMERQQVAHGVDKVPGSWLEGEYLAEASRFPEVLTFWERYATYVHSMRASEAQIFRASVLNRLRAEGVSESQLSMRLARALRTFNADFPRREAVYAGMLELSAAAIELHDFLVENEDEISYEPADAGVSREPITEAVPESREVGERMNRSLDRLILALEATQGNRIAPRDELPQTLRRGLASNGAPMS